MDIADAMTLVLELARASAEKIIFNPDWEKDWVEACDVVEDFIVNQLGDE